MAAHFLNADLDIFSERDLQPLIDEIGGRAMLLHGGPFSDGLFMARYEIDHDEDAKTPGNLIVSFCELISSLSPQNRELWNSSRERVIDLGYQIASHRDRIMDHLSPDALKRMADLKISLAWTFYPPEE